MAVAYTYNRICGRACVAAKGLAGVFPMAGLTVSEALYHNEGPGTYLYFDMFSVITYAICFSYSIYCDLVYFFRLGVTLNVLMF